MKYSRYEVRSALLAANRLIHCVPVSAEKVSATLAPYFDCDGFHQIPDGDEKGEALRSMIFALTADGYREEGRFLEAAEWYRKASAISPGGHAAIYAHMVCKHRLSASYADALNILEINSQRWKARPLFYRIYWRIRTWRSWCYRDARDISFSVEKNLLFLRAEIKKNA